MSRSSSNSSTRTAIFSLRTRNTTSSRPAARARLVSACAARCAGIFSRSASPTTCTNSLRRITALRSATFSKSSRGKRSNSATYCAVNPKDKPFTSTSSTRITAKDKGRRKEKRVPAPGRVSTFTTPCRSSITHCLTTSMPTPRPDRSVMMLLVEKPGRKMRSTTSCSVSAAACSALRKPFFTAFSRTAGSEMPAPSSATSITTQPPSCRADSVSRP